jgi:hypothetical protein
MLRVGARLHRPASRRPRRDVHATVGGGSFGASSLRPHLGLGQSTSIDLLEIRWPGSGTLQQFRGLAADRIYRIREDAKEAQALAPDGKVTARAAN